jgi:hypothetical protein
MYYVIDACMFTLKREFTYLSDAKNYICSFPAIERETLVITKIVISGYEL